MMFIFCCVLLLSLQDVFCEENKFQWVVNQEFKIKPTKAEEAKNNFYFDFECPKGFITYGDYCYLNVTISKSNCPKLRELNTTYSLNHHYKNKDEEFSPDLNCSYHVEEFLDISKSDNSLKLNLFLDVENEKIVLDTFLDQPEKALKILCLQQSKLHRNYATEIKMNLEDDQLNENSTTRRYSFNYNNITKLSIFYCCSYASGRIKPVASNLIFGNQQIKHKHEVFYATFSKMIDKASNEICVVNETKISYLIQMDHKVGLYSKTQIMMYVENELNLKNLKEIKSTKYCFKEKSNKTNSIWPKTLIGETAYPQDLCLNKNNQFIARKCGGDNFNGGEWEEEIDCFNKTLPPITTELLKINVINSKKNLDDLQNIIMNQKLSEIDAHIIINIFESTPSFNESWENEIFSIINTISKLPIESQTTKSKIIKNIERFVTIFSTKNNSNVIKSHGDIKYFSLNPFKIKKFNGYDVALTKAFLKSLKLTAKEEKDFVMNVINFENNKLFLKNDEIYGKVVDIKFVGIKKFNNFSKPIILNFPREDNKAYKCGFWDETTKMWSTFDVLTKINPESIECQSYHLTKFALLIVSSDIVIPRRITYFDKIIDFISAFELFLSAIGCCIVLLLALSIREWRSTRSYITQLSLVIFLEASLLLIIDANNNILNTKFCIYFAISLHFLVLEKFLLMFMFGLSQLENFMKIFKKLKKIVRKSSCSGAFFRWIVPFLISFTSILCYLDEKYYRTDAGEIQFCYPKHEPHLYFVIIPVSIILCFNIIVFVIVITKISGSPSIDAQKKLFQFKLTVLLWFLLGGSWISGVLMNIRQGGIFEDVCYYIFILIAPLQGFVLFIFYVVLDKSSGEIVKKSIWSNS
nr:adhesion G-protein coupled receptor G4-like [Onthophagus taurus]